MVSMALSDLLDERKHVTTRKELESLAERYGIDVEKLESVARFVNTPTVEDGSVRRVTDEDGNEKVTMLVSDYFVESSVLWLENWTDGACWFRLRGKILSL